LGFGAYTFIAALAYRFFAHRLPRYCVIVYPAAWTLIEYGRTMTDLAFPWAYAGYSAAGILPLAQFASFTGVWGLSYLVVLGNVVIWELLRAIRARENIQQKWLAAGVWAALIIGIFVWGIFRMNINHHTADSKTVKVALMQSYMDQFHWKSNSLDTAITISDSMVRIAAKANPDVMIFPESALLCYLDRRPDIRREVLSWVEDTKIPIIAGALHWDKPEHASDDEYDVYNTVFLADSGKLAPYHKIMLVPFSEAMPFAVRFPILSRVSVGGSGFKRGDEEKLFRINEKIEAAPYICYEIIFPSFVRRRLTESTNLIIGVTNDGWFGRSSGPYQHAAMAQMRSIENGITLARAANSGISMFVDPYGRVLSKSRLYTREIITRDIPTFRIITFYARFGDWFVAFCAIVTVAGILACFINSKRAGEITNPLLIEIEEQKLAAAKT
jgi:apolipoprotein N-acyltransferase